MCSFIALNFPACISDIENCDFADNCNFRNCSLASGFMYSRRVYSIIVMIRDVMMGAFRSFQSDTPAAFRICSSLSSFSLQKSHIIAMKTAVGRM